MTRRRRSGWRVPVALLALPVTSADDAARYAAFRRRWCGLDDGHATDRVLDRLLDRVLPGADAQPAGRFR